MYTRRSCRGNACAILEKPGFSASALLAGKLLITGSSTMAPMVEDLAKRFRMQHPGSFPTFDSETARAGAHQLHPIWGAPRSKRAANGAIARFLIYVIELPAAAGMIVI